MKKKNHTKTHCVSFSLLFEFRRCLQFHHHGILWKSKTNGVSIGFDGVLLEMFDVKFEKFASAPIKK